MEYKKIKEFADVVSGSTPKTNVEKYWNGEYPWITPAEIGADTRYICNSQRKLTDAGVKSASLKLLKKDTVLLTSRAPIGKVAISGVDLYCNQGFKNLICNEKIALARYLYYWLSSKTEYLNSLGRGATFKEISKSIVEEIEVPVPKIANQRKIANALDKSQFLIDKRKEQIEACDELIKSLFYDMFGDPISNSKLYTKQKLNKVCEIVTGNTPSRKETDNYGNFIEWIKSDNINTSSHYITKSEEFLSEKGLQKGRWVDSGAILMTCIAGSLSCIGNVALTDRKVSFNQQINGVIGKNGQIDNKFLYMQFLLCKPYIQGASTNGMKGMVSKGVLSNLEFIVPKIEEQKNFAQLFDTINKQKQLLQQSLTELEDNFNSLMQRAFKGELF